MTKSSKQQPPRKHRWLWRTIFTLGILLGLALVFNEPIKLFVVDHLSQTTMAHIDRDTVDKNEKKHATFDFKGVKALDINTVGNAAITRNLHPIGKIAISSVNLKLPILKGLSNDNLSAGAGTMKADQKMGEGNYALAGHYMTNQGILFSPLKNVKKGDTVVITNMKHIYTYKVTTKQIVNETQVQWIDDVAGKKLITLVTCASPTEGEVDRIIVQGELQSVKDANSQNLKIFL
ncbi:MULTISPECIES: class A sortase [Lacticaseibacillus]|uniref:Class A sortase n=2 Tax=Lacticaseibacillus zeae TaxID=57037 RepID=A0A5R8LXJ8_LACZE|nr:MULTISPECIES: class A sortase [Lacticaseibacillus]OFR91483.1 sortase [Lactobacillus sp. HMSC068F07]MDE3283090.1 class A sortase [Lacticaseibacillus casei]MDE3315816.1 class A sortase [Lacticaseibacillus zeae]OLS03983.1 sortase [Lacticaseibacillus casei]QVI31254.1 class A sortase [Lacticaseibacillus zeae]